MVSVLAGIKRSAQADVEILQEGVCFLSTRHGNAADATRIRSPRAQTLSGARRRDRWRLALDLCAVSRSVRSLVGGFAAARSWRGRSRRLSCAQYSCAVGVVLLRPATRGCAGAIELSPDCR